MNNARFYDVKSFTTTGLFYKVRKMPNGSYKCDCPRFVFTGKKCDHIRRIQHLKLKNHGRNKN